MTLMVFLAAAAVAAPNAAPAPAAGGTLQERFNAASELAAADKCIEAVPRFEALEKSPHVKPGSFAAASIAVRKGTCLVRLARYSEGESAIDTGLAALVAAGPKFASDVSDARLALGDVHMARSDRAGAAGYFRQALESRTGETRLVPLARLSRALAFDGGEAALAPSREALQILGSGSQTNKLVLAGYHTLYARTLLNQGRNEEAYTELRQALSLSGGLTFRSSVEQFSLRSDLAMAAMLTKHPSDARRYLAYTGAGRTRGAPLMPAESMESPLCGTETGLRPDDVAIVEFGIRDDGTISHAETVYSRGGPEVAAAFEQAVREWYWKPEDAAKLPPFYRAAVRMELRCSNRLGDAPDVWAPLTTRFREWAQSALPATATAGDDRKSVLNTMRPLAADTSGATSPAARAAALGLILSYDPFAPDASAQTALDLATGAQAPPAAINWLRVEQLRRSIKHGSYETGNQAGKPRPQTFTQLAGDPALATDPLAVDTLLLAAAQERFYRRQPQSNTWLLSVAQDARLPEHHPLRQLSWLELANRAAANHDLPQAQDYYGKTGLTAEQCALISLPPAMRRSNATGSSYPLSALFLGFEGWVNIEHDIKADGTPANVRALAAYPPLIFIEAATALAGNVQYDPTYRPEQSTACSAHSVVIGFGLR